MYNNNAPQQGQQFAKNPNGGYLKRSTHSPDGWYGRIAITPELLASAQKTGFITLNVNDPQTNQYGEARRVTAKPYVEKAPQGGYNNNQPQQYNQQPVTNNAGFQVQPNHPSVAPQGSTNEIPW